MSLPILRVWDGGVVRLRRRGIPRIEHLLDPSYTTIHQEYLYTSWVVVLSKDIFDYALHLTACRLIFFEDDRNFHAAADLIVRRYRHGEGAKSC
jgi:hypothetical protein